GSCPRSGPSSKFRPPTYSSRSQQCLGTKLLRSATEEPLLLTLIPTITVGFELLAESVEDQELLVAFLIRQLSSINSLSRTAGRSNLIVYGSNCRAVIFLIIGGRSPSRQHREHQHEVDPFHWDLRIGLGGESHQWQSGSSAPGG